MPSPLENVSKPKENKSVDSSTQQALYTGGDSLQRVAPNENLTPAQKYADTTKKSQEEQKNTFIQKAFSALKKG